MDNDWDVGNELLVTTQSDDFVFDEENFMAGDDMIFGNELLAINIGSIVTARETQRVEQAKKQLNEVIATLINCHIASSLPLTTEYVKRFLCIFLSDIF